MAASARTEDDYLKHKRKVPLDELEKFLAERLSLAGMADREPLCSPGVWLVTYKKDSGKPVLD